MVAVKPSRTHDQPRFTLPGCSAPESNRVTLHGPASARLGTGHPRSLAHRSRYPTTGTSRRRHADSCHTGHGPFVTLSVSCNRHAGACTAIQDRPGMVYRCICPRRIAQSMTALSRCAYDILHKHRKGCLCGIRSIQCRRASTPEGPSCGGRVPAEDLQQCEDPESARPFVFRHYLFSLGRTEGPPSMPWEALYGVLSDFQPSRARCYPLAVQSAPMNTATISAAAISPTPSSRGASTSR